MVDSFGDPSPFTSFEDGAPFIGLPSRLVGPFREIALRRAAVDALHETSHVFTLSIRNPGPATERSWRWFNEATAIFFEGELYPGNPEVMRYYRHWADRPDVPLDDRDELAHYAAGMFVRYLARRFDPALVRSAWTDSAADESPLVAIDRLVAALEPGEWALRPGESMIFPDYCLDSYFILDPLCTLFAPAVWARYKSRFLAGAPKLRTGAIEGRLDHLACHYYRIDVGKNRVRAELNFTQGSASIRGQVAEVSHMSLRGRSWTLPADLADIKTSKTDHLILVVSNASLTADRVAYRISVTV